MWGADPLSANTAKIQTASPSLSAFPLARIAPPITFAGSGLPEEEGTDLPPGSFLHTGLPHPEAKDNTGPLGQLRLNVAPHVVEYDPDRNLWYCDIVIRPPAGTYFPFIRLALARFNPYSAHRAHLSPIAITEFQQLAPDRLVIVTKNTTANTAHISVYGVEGVSSTASLEPVRFEADTQVLAGGGDPDLDWRTVKVEPPKGLQLSARAARMATTRTLNKAAPFKREAERALREENFNELVLNPNLVLALRPPLIWETDIALPEAPAGGRRRILVTEKEHHRKEVDDLGVEPILNTAAAQVRFGSRIVYLETLDV